MCGCALELSGVKREYSAECRDVYECMGYV